MTIIAADFILVKLFNINILPIGINKIKYSISYIVLYY